MLSSLQIENVAVIQKANVHFEKGLNVLTGETGAGKSILIDSINAILGNRTSKDLVRTGAAKAVIRAAFDDVPPAVLDSLEKAGYEVIVPEFECCGLPMVANGFFDDARAAASRNVDTLAALVSSGDVPVLTVCPSCQLMLKQEYAEYFPELGKHESIVPHVQDACEFLIGLIESGELDIDVREDATKLVYHAPCHLRAQGIGKPGLDLLRMASANVEDARSGCCGISGSYGFKKEKYDVAASVGSDLFKAVTQCARLPPDGRGSGRIRPVRHTGTSPACRCRERAS